MSAPTTSRQAAPVHDFDCAECGKRIGTPVDGFLAIRYTDAQAAEFAWADYDHKHRHDVDADGRPKLLPLDWAEVDSMPGDAPWRAYHYGCHGDTDPALYTVALERLAQWQQVADWTAHLLETRSWLPHTDWGGVLRRFAGT